MDPVKIFFNVIRILIMFALIVFFIYMYGLNLEIAAGKEIDMVTIQVADNILTSPLTISKSVFSFKGLMNYTGTRIEPYFRHCKYAYKIQVHDLSFPENLRVACRTRSDSDKCDKKCKELFGNDVTGECDIFYPTCKCKKNDDEIAKSYYSFGYFQGVDEQVTTIGLLEKSEKRLPAAIKYNNSLHPAELVVTLYETWLTRIACMIEKTYYDGQERKMYIPCIKSYGSHYFIPDITWESTRWDNYGIICFKDRDYPCRIVPYDALPQNVIINSNLGEYAEGNAIVVRKSGNQINLVFEP